MSDKYFKYVSPNGVAGIKPNNYSSSIQQIMEMVEIARADFPGITDTNIHTVAYDGDRWKRQTGIEFRVDAISAPEDYMRITQLEYAFAGN